MKRVFRKVGGKIVPNVIDHAIACITKWPFAEVHIGTDSQNKRRHTTFSTVIAFRYGTRGVHYIYTIRKVPKIRVELERLMQETTDSMEVAEWVRASLPHLDIQIDLDYNSDEKFLSNKVADSMYGWVVGSGYKGNLKPDNQIATKAADSHCR